MRAYLRSGVLLGGTALLATVAAWHFSVGCASVESDGPCPSALPRCGDGCTDPSLGESCDDGNRVSGDGCDMYCHREGVGCPRPSPSCGDGCVDGSLGEECDDANRMPGDGCDPLCRREGTTDAGDVGDDGGADDATVPPDDGDVYVPPDDSGTDTGSCPESPCRLMPQCGCPAGQKCTLDPASTSTTLVKQCAAAGTRNETQTCTAETDCTAGTGCFVLFSESTTSTEAMCYRYCASASDCTGVGSLCVPLLTTASYPGYCSHSCNIISNSGCPSGTKCMPLVLSATSQLLTDCSADAGYGSAGSYCTVEADCGIGTFCGAESGVNECIAYCTNPPYGSCSGGYTCNSFTEPFILGGTEYGYCY
jgi:cysteine-rich repeat protein